MSDVLNPPNPTPDSGGGESRKKSRIPCDFCGCELGQDGGVLKTSEKAKAFERADVTISQLKRDNTDLQGRLDTANQQLEELKAPPPDTPGSKANDSHDQPPSRAFAY